MLARCLAVLLTATTLVAQDTQLVLSLVDGSKLKVRPADPEFRFKGKAYRWDRAASLRRTRGDSFVLRLASGVVVRGAFDAADFAAESVLGELQIRVGACEAITVRDAAPLTRAMRQALLMHWSFDGAGDQVADHSPHARHGRLFDGERSEGVVRGGVQFDGEERVEVQDSPALDLPGEMTLSMWFKLDAFGRPGEPGLCTKGIPGFESWALVVGEQCVSFIRRQRSGKSWVQANTGAGVKLGEWHHVIAMADGKRLRMWLDGHAVDGPSYTGTFDVDDEPLTVGARQSWSGDYDWGIRGAVDEVMLFNRALSREEVWRLLM